MHTGHAAVGDEVGRDPERVERGETLLGDGKVGGARRDDRHARRAGRRRAPHERATGADASRVAGQGSVGLVVVGASQQHRAAVVFGQQLGHQRRALVGRLTGAVDRLGQSLPQRAVVVDAGEAEVGER